MAVQPPSRPKRSDAPKIPLLHTKLYIPAPRPGQVPRPRLIERLNAGLSRKLTLISAPAGFGKTTLLGEWIESREYRVGSSDHTSERSLTPHSSLPTPSFAWLSLGEGDNDLTRFLVYLMSALQTVEANIGRGVLSALQSPQPPPAEVVLTTLINEMATLPDRRVLVLDDYHLIETQPIHDALTFLLDHLPPPPGGLHLVIATREDPPLPLARLRARGQLTELRAADLRFTPSEAAEFLNQVMGLDLPAEDVAALETRTEGWIAGLQLAAISMQGRKDVTGFIQSFTGSHHFVLDYLVKEVLEQQPDSVQDFLLRTSILDRLCGPLCDAVAGLSISHPTHDRLADSQATLETLEHANLFIIPLDDERRWYRYHHLFADLLRQRLHRTQPERVPDLYRRASEWHERNGFVDEAIDHALRGEYYKRAAWLIEDHYDGNYDRGDQTALRRWLAEFPEEFVFSEPHLCILYAWNLFTIGQLDAVERTLQAAEKMLGPNTDRESVSSPDVNPLSDTNRMKLEGQATVIRSFIASYSGDMPATIRYARQALEVLPERELEWRSAALVALGDAYASQGQMVAAHEARTEALATSKASGDTYILIMVHLRLAEILRQQGKLQQVIELCERQFKSADNSGMSEWAIVGWLLGIWGEVLAERGHLDRAIDRAKKGAKLTARGGDVLYLVMSNLCLVRVLFSGGDIQGAQDAIQSMEHTARKAELPLWATRQLSAWQVRIWLAQGKREVASRWARERELDPDGEPTYQHEVEYVALARILVAQGRLEQAARLLQRLLEAAEAGGRHSRAIEILTLQALAHQAEGDTDQAMAALERALALAEPGGFIRTFVDEGPPVVRLLQRLRRKGVAVDYVERILGAFEWADAQASWAGRPAMDREWPASPAAHRPSSALVEPLSERELEVLELIAEGLTNPEIASRLFVALNTVKGHTRNIYGKLDVHNRTQAVARARALGVLPST